MAANAQHPPDWYCPGRSKHTGQRCRRRAGSGTDHVGHGLCKHHMGNTPSARKNAAMSAATEEIKVMAPAMGWSIDVDPLEALMACVRITAGEVVYATNKVHALEEDQVVVTPLEIKERPLSEGKDGESATQTVQEHQHRQEELNLWIKVRAQKVGALAKYSKMALDAGVQERTVRVQERMGDSIAAAFSILLEGLDLSIEQRRVAPDLVRRAMTRLDAGGLDSPGTVIG